MPKFETTCEYPLGATLQAMGMRRAFLRGAAELDGMRSPPPPLFISAVQHKAFVRVDERGTEAAAATGVMVAFSSGRGDFKANKPFLYVIRHLPTQSVVFVGRVSDPSKGGK
jgi:serine protease inhibitor